MVKEGQKTTEPILPASPPVTQVPSLPEKPRRGRILVWAIIGGFVAGVLGSILVFFIVLPVLKSQLPGVVTQKQENLTVNEESGIIAAVKKIQPVVVSIISTTNVMDFFGEVTQEQGGGSGVIISKDGLILTNKHVIEDATAEYKVVLADGRNFPAKIVSTDPLNDLGVVKIAASDLPVAVLGDSDALQIGQRVVAVGNALGEFQNTVTAGIVSATERTITAGTGASAELLEGLIQTDAAINPGNSGGPLINLEGQVVGINTAIAQEAQNIGFALPINQAKFAITSVLTKGKIIRPYLGVRFVTITKQLAELEKLSRTAGALIISGSEAGAVAVAPNSPADKAGLKEGDIIVKIGDKVLSEKDTLAKVLTEFEPKSQVEITFVRNGVEQKVTVTLGELQN